MIHSKVDRRRALAVLVSCALASAASLSACVQYDALPDDDRIDTPLLLLHGLADANVTPGESEELFTALRVQGKPVELVLYPGEGHGISGTWENRVDHRNLMPHWVDRYLKDQPEAWQARW